MQMLVNLFLTFFKIGLFGFGGGYAMVSLIENELVSKGWLSLKNFIDIIAIAEMTPGPIAVNSATFVGYKISSIVGSTFATLGVIAPSFILILVLARLFSKVKDSPVFNGVINFLRPAVIGLIISAAVSFGQSSLIDWKSFLISGGVFLAMLTKKVNPILLILLSGLIGVIVY